MIYTLSSHRFPSARPPLRAPPPRPHASQVCMTYVKFPPQKTDAMEECSSGPYGSKGQGLDDGFVFMDTTVYSSVTVLSMHLGSWKWICEHLGYYTLIYVFALGFYTETSHFEMLHSRELTLWDWRFGIITLGHIKSIRFSLRKTSGDTCFMHTFCGSTADVYGQNDDNDRCILRI